MTKPLPPKQLSLEDAFIDLNLNNLTHPEAIVRLLRYAQHDGLKIYINAKLDGYEVSKPIDAVRDESGEVTRLLIDGDAVFVEPSISPILYKSGSYDYIEGGNFSISVFSFMQSELEYYSVDETSMFVESCSVNEGAFYILREDLLEFIDAAEKDIVLKSFKEKKTTGSKEAQNLLKAIALLSVSAASSSSKYRVGNSVNASAFKNHIVDLAEEYGIEKKEGLNSLDDKINKMLNVLDLKELSKYK